LPASLLVERFINDAFDLAGGTDFRPTVDTIKHRVARPNVGAAQP
jgi:hypothetical protein